MTKNNNSKQLEDFNDFSIWTPLPSKNPTDDEIRTYSNLRTEEEVLSERWQNKIGEGARRKKAIVLLDLVYIFANEEVYSDILPQLWKEFELDDNSSIPEWKYFWRNTPYGRTSAWYWLLLQWTIYPCFVSENGGEIESYYFVNVRYDKPLLNLYKKDLQKPVERNQIQSPTQYIKLDELKGCLESSH